MSLEGREYDWITCIYWTMTNMFTLGLGDIVFTSSGGKLFTILVMLSGLIFIFIAMPYAIIQLFQSSARIHRDLPKFFRDHVILTNLDPVSETLIPKLQKYNINNFLIIPDQNKAQELKDKGYNVILGSPDDCSLYGKIQTSRAAGIAISGDDIINTASAYAIRKESDSVPIVSVTSSKSTDIILGKIGVNSMVNITDLLGQALSRRITAGDALAHTVGEFGALQVAEAAVVKNIFSGKTLKEIDLKKITGMSVMGVLEEGEFHMAGPDTKISDRSTLLLAGSKSNVDSYNEFFSIYNIAIDPVVVIGYGKVGKEVTRLLIQKSIDYIIVDKKDIYSKDKSVITGDASESDTLKKAGLANTPAVVITTLNDSANIYITSLVRAIRPDVQIITCCVMERNADLLYRAGADAVISYSQLGANYMFNALFRNNILMVEDDVYIIRVKMPAQLAGKTLLNSSIRESSGCNVMAIEEKDLMFINPPAKTVLSPAAKLIIICNEKSEKKFFELFDTELN
jgi:Trk K+ transport system NAD-binding subunit